MRSTMALSDVDSIDIELLHHYFEQLNLLEEKAEEHQKLIIETWKLAIYLAVKKKLEKINNIISVEEQDDSVSTLQRSFDMTYAVFGTGISMLSRYYGCMAILGLLSFITHPVAIAISIGVAVLGGAYFIAKDVRELKSKLQVPFHESRQLINIYKKQTKTTQEIQQLMLTHMFASSVKVTEIKKYHGMVNCFHGDIRKKHAEINRQTEHVGSRFAKLSMIVTDSLLATGAGFLLGKAVLTLLPVVVLASNPVGFAICSAMATFCLVSCLVLKYKEITNTIDKVAGNTKKLVDQQQRLLYGAQGVGHFNQKMNGIVAKKNKLNKNLYSTNQIKLKAKTEHHVFTTKNPTHQRYKIRTANSSDFYRIHSKAKFKILSHRLFFNKNHRSENMVDNSKFTFCVPSACQNGTLKKK